MSSFYEGQDPDVDPEGAKEAVAQAKAWAIKIDGPVEGTEYSAQYNAGLSKQYRDQSNIFAQNSLESSNRAEEAADKLDSLLVSDLVDVSNTPPEDTAVLAWNEANQLWEPTLMVASQTASVNELIRQMTDLRDKLIAVGIIQP